MPAKSKKQFRLMQAVASGDAKLPGLSKEQAAEYISGQTSKLLPESYRKSSPQRSRSWRFK